MQALGGIVHIYTLYMTFYWMTIYPNPNGVALTAWLLLLSTGILSLWMPLAVILVHYQIKRRLLFITVQNKD